MTGTVTGGDDRDRSGVAPLRFDWVADDLCALDGDIPVIAEGWGLLPDLVAPVVADIRQVIILTATRSGGAIRSKTWAGPPDSPRRTRFSDPVRARQNRDDRDL